MDLSNIIGSGAKPYLEYGWVTAPNTAGQSITANTITTLTIDTEVADTGGFGSIASNQITLAAGTYYYEANTTVYFNDTGGAVFSLFNNTSSSYVGRIGAGIFRQPPIVLKGQFTISTQSVFSLQFLCSAAVQIRTGQDVSVLTLATAGADQRTTIKLWKLA